MPGSKSSASAGQLLFVGGSLLILLAGFYALDRGCERLSDSWDDAVYAVDQKAVDDENKLREAVGPLADFPEVASIHVHGNDVYIGFNYRPDDLDALLRNYALRGNRATDFGVHLWAGDASVSGWRENGPYWSQVTARHGQIEE